MNTIPQFFTNPITDYTQAVQLKNAMTADAMAQRQFAEQTDAREGFESAYQAMLKPGTEWTMPENASYAYTTGVANANELYQNQQTNFYNSNIAPILQYAVQQGDNRPIEYLQRHAESIRNNPFGGLASNILSSVKGISVTAPGKVEGVLLSDELISTALSGTTDPTVLAMLKELVGETVNLEIKDGRVTSVTRPKATALKKFEYVDENGNVITSMVDASGNEIISGKGVPKQGSTARYAATGVPGVSRDRQTGKYYISETDAQGNLINREVSTEEVYNLARVHKEGQAAAGQAGGPKTAALYRADTLFQSLAPKLIMWKSQLQAQDKDRVLKLVTSSKTYNELTNKIEAMATDNPTQALLLKNTVLLADALSTVYGAGPGGQWSFEVAKSMLDPNLGLNSFKATLESHGDKIRESLAASQNFPRTVRGVSSVVPPKVGRQSETAPDSFQPVPVPAGGGKTRLAPKKYGQQLTNDAIKAQYLKMAGRTPEGKWDIKKAVDLARADGWRID